MSGERAFLVETLDSPTLGKGIYPICSSVLFLLRGEDAGAGLGGVIGSGRRASLGRACVDICSVERRGCSVGLARLRLIHGATDARHGAGLSPQETTLITGFKAPK